MTKTKSTYLALVAVLLSLLMVLASQNVYATIIYDEGSSGDLSNLPGAPTGIGALGLGDNDVIGSIGPSTNFDDNFTFSIGAGQILVDIVLFAYDVNNSSRFALFAGGTVGDLFSGPFLTAGQFTLGNVGTDFLAGGLGAGTYSMGIRESNLPDANYTVRLAVVAVPEPGTLALLGLGLAGMGLTRRRKKV